MQGSELITGRKYAWSSAPKSAAEELRKVAYVGPCRRGMARIRWLDGELTGLDEWTATRNLLCEWEERRAVLRDRERQRQLDDLAQQELDSVVEDAISWASSAPRRSAPSSTRSPRSAESRGPSIARAPVGHGRRRPAAPIALIGSTVMRCG